MSPQTIVHHIDVVSVVAAAVSTYITWQVFRTLTVQRIGALPFQPCNGRSAVKDWILGHLAEILEKGEADAVNGPYRRWVGEGKPAVALRFLYFPRILTADAADIDYILNSNVGNYGKGRPYVVMQRLLGKGLITLIDDQEHAMHRREVSPAFSPAALKHISNACVPLHAQTLIATLDSCAARGEKVLVEPLMVRVVLCVLAQAAFRTSGEVSTDIVAKNLDKGVENGWSLLRLSSLIDSLLFFKNARVREVRADMKRLVEAVRSEKTGEAPTTEENGNALVDFLLNSKKLDLEYITDHSITFLFAGYDTTSNTLIWLAYLLAKHPAAQEKLYEELSATVAKDAACAVDDLKGCKYLYACIKETMRLLGPATFLARQCRTDDVLPGSKAFIPAGMEIIMPLSITHRNKKVWGEDADEFVPERWEEEDFEAKVETSYLPFSAGRRNCIGKDFAMNEMAMLAAAIYRNFRLEWPVGEPEPETEAMPTLRPKAPFNVLVHKRNS